jgi:hydrogenase maturation factor
MLRAVVDDRERMGCGELKPLPVGKLPLENLRSLLKRSAKHDPRLLIGPQIGEDAAVIDAGDRYLVVATDPVTFATDQIGRYAVYVNANDVAVMGARPLWFFVVMLLPEERTTPELAEAIMADVRTACEELDVALGGGHTEITQGLDRPILVGQMVAEVAPTRLVRKTRIAIGDQILLTQGVAIEGTAILARQKSERLRGRVDADVLERGARFLIAPGISVVSAPLAAPKWARPCTRCMIRPKVGSRQASSSWWRQSVSGFRCFASASPCFSKLRGFAKPSHLIR